MINLRASNPPSSKAKLTRISSCKNILSKNEFGISTNNHSKRKKVESLPDTDNTRKNNISRNSSVTNLTRNIKKAEPLPTENSLQPTTPRKLPLLILNPKKPALPSAETPKSFKLDLIERHRQGYLDRNMQVNLSVMRTKNKLIPEGKKAKFWRKLEAYLNLPASENLTKFFAKVGIKDTPHAQKFKPSVNSTNTPSIEYGIEENMPQEDFTKWLTESSRHIARNLKNPYPVVDPLFEYEEDLYSDSFDEHFDEEIAKRPKMERRGNQEKIAKSLNDLCDSDRSLSDIQRDYLLQMRKRSETMVKVLLRNRRFRFNAKKDAKTQIDLSKDLAPSPQNKKIAQSLINLEEVSPKDEIQKYLRTQPESEQISTARTSVASGKESKKTPGVYCEDIRLIVSRINEEKKHQKSALQAIKKMSSLFEKKGNSLRESIL